MMPLRLVFVRHGQSEGNIATGLLESGQYDQVPEAIRQVPGWQWRLTPEGRNQAELAGQWIRANVEGCFAIGYVSCYPRAMETAGLLDIEARIWRPIYYIRERGWGQLDCLPGTEEEIRCCLEEFRRREADRLFWCPPNGETIIDTAFRIDRFYDTLHRECEDDQVIVVMHGEAMWAARINLERLLPRVAQEMMNSPEHKIRNGGILEYTRIDPFTGDELTHLDWVRLIDPTNPPQDPNSAWRKIERHRYTSAELLEEARHYPTYF